MENQKFNLLGVEMSIEEYDFFMCERAKGKELKVKDGKVVAEYHVPTEEEIKENLRRQREALLVAFDKWEKAVLRGREEDSKVVMEWYQDLLDLKERAFENVPERIKYYL